MKKFDICGFQTDPDNGVSIEDFILASRTLDCDRFVVWTIGGNSALAYFLVNIEFDDMLGITDREDIENFISEILNDVEKENIDGEYVWNNGNGDVNIKLVYAYM